MKSIKYLQDLSKLTGMNDTELARLLGITKQAISNYKAGTRVMDDETCLAVALKLEIDPLQVVGAACIDRAEKTGQHSLWENFMMRTAHVASGVLVAIVAIGSFNSDAKACESVQFKNDPFRHTVKNISPRPQKQSMRSFCLSALSNGK